MKESRRTGRQNGGYMNDRKLRRHYRAKFFTEVQALNYPKGSQDKSNAKQLELVVLNLSIDGVGILSKECIEKGSIVTFTLYLGGIGHEIMGYVTFCRKIGEMYRVGLKLVSPDNMFTSMLMSYIDNEKSES